MDQRIENEEAQAELALSGPPPNAPLAIEYIMMGEIRFNPENPRRHTPKQIHGLAERIAESRFVMPVCIDASSMLLAGEARVRACRLLRWTTIPAIRLEHLTPAQAKVFMLAENRFAELASWDEAALGRIFSDLSKEGLDFSLELSGFETGDIDFFIAALDLNVGEEAEVEEPPVGPAVSRLGDTFIMESPASGRTHRLHVADALLPASYAQLMDGELAGAAITDPPYGSTIASYMPSGKHREFVMGSEGRSPAELAGLLQPACAHIRDACRAGALVYVFMDWRGIETLLGVGASVFGELKNIIVWAKPAAGMGSHYRSQHELCPIFKVAGGRHRNNIELGVHGRNRSNLWSYAGMTSASARKTDEGDLLGSHPSCKPVDMIADAILDCTERGDLVLDPFAGSGTILVAAERTGRRAFAMELDPLYADVAIRRYQRLTGVKAVREADGRLFEDLAAEVCDE